MTFAQKLNEYLTELDCTLRELSRYAGVSVNYISRCRNGKMMPSPESEQLHRLAAAIARMMREQGVAEIDEETVLSSFTELLEELPEESLLLSARLNELVTALDLNLTDLAENIHFDTSYLASICAGRRAPMDPGAFSFLVTSTLLSYCGDESFEQKLCRLIGCREEEPVDPMLLIRMTRSWLYPNQESAGEAIPEFLHQLDRFRMNDYLDSLHFSEQKLSSFSRAVSGSRIYYGTQEMHRGEMDFLRTVLQAKNGTAVYFFSDMPMDAQTQKDFDKRWMLTLALSLKKGLHVHLIMREDHPWLSFLPGLDHWIPLLISGKLTPYILKNEGPAIFRHCLLVSDRAALNGECISGHPQLGSYYLTTNKEELVYYKNMMSALLKKAEPILTVYRKDAQNSFENFMHQDLNVAGKRTCISCSLPLFTMKKEMLSSLVQRHNLSKQASSRLLNYADRQRDRVETLLSRWEMDLTIPDLTEDEFMEQPLCLPFADAYVKKTIPYTYADYLAHMKQTREYAASHPNITLHVHRGETFRNLNLTIHENQWALLSGFHDPPLKLQVRSGNLLSLLENCRPLR